MRVARLGRGRIHRSVYVGISFQSDWHLDINTIRAWLGHVSIDTTSIYAETDLATKKRALATLDRGTSRLKSGGWSRQPDVMAFLRTL